MNLLKNRLIILAACAVVMLCGVLAVSFQNVRANVTSVTEPEESTNRKYIKWVDFTINSRALNDAMELDISTFGSEKHLSWIDILSFLACKNAGDFSGVILLASYSTADLSKLPLKVLSVYGSNDGVLNMEKYEEFKTNLPQDFSEKIIDGGCHAYFGAYGAQEGDNEPGITRDEQISITANAILDFTEGQTDKINK